LYSSIVYVLYMEYIRLVRLVTDNYKTDRPFHCHAERKWFFFFEKILIKQKYLKKIISCSASVIAGRHFRISFHFILAFTVTLITGFVRLSAHLGRIAFYTREVLLVFTSCSQ
jgi:hypothetical protein